MSEENETVFDRLLPINYHDEWFDGEALHMKVSLTRADVERLNELAGAARKVNADTITDFTGGMTYGDAEEEDSGELVDFEVNPEFRPDCERVVILVCRDETYVWWQGYVKHTNVRYSTDQVKLVEINRQAELSEAA